MPSSHARAALPFASLRTGLAACALVAACAHGHPAAAGASTATAPAPALTDANVAAVVVAANDADISYAELALAKAARPDVHAFAQTMLNDHTSVNRAAAALVGRLGVTPEDNEASLDMRDDAAAKRDTLRALGGAAFDSAYVANEVRYHTRLLAAMDGTLIPGAHNAELRSLLEDVRPTVAAHLAHAQMLQQELRK